MTDERESTAEAQPDVKYEVINPPNRLRAKVGQSRSVDERCIAHAETNYAKDRESCVGWADEPMAALSEILNALENDPMSRMAQMERLYRVIHDLRGLGGTFGYPLVTKICANLGLHMDKLATPTDIDDSVVCAHIDALRAVFNEKAGGEDDATGAELVAELQALVREFS